MYRIDNDWNYFSWYAVHFPPAQHNIFFGITINNDNGIFTNFGSITDSCAVNAPLEPVGASNWL